MLKYLELKEKPREFLAATGHRDEEFQALLPAFATCYEPDVRTLIVNA